MHLQTLWPRCGRRETTAAHISTAWASPGQEAELAVARGWGGAGRAAPSSLTESLSHGRAGCIIWGALAQKLLRISSWQQQSVKLSWGPCQPGASVHLVNGLLAWLPAQGSPWHGTQVVELV